MTSDKIVIVNYIKITLSTSTEIVGRNRRSFDTAVQLYARYSTVWLAYDCPREHVRLFISTDVITKSSRVTLVDDYK